jgi:hypothetical protein
LVFVGWVCFEIVVAPAHRYQADRKWPFGEHQSVFKRYNSIGSEIITFNRHLHGFIAGYSLKILTCMIKQANFGPTFYRRISRRRSWRRPIQGFHHKEQTLYWPPQRFRWVWLLTMALLWGQKAVQFSNKIVWRQETPWDCIQRIAITFSITIFQPSFW